MSRVPDKIKAGTRVLFEDTTIDKNVSMIFTGTAYSYDSDKDVWKVKEIRVHSIESTKGLTVKDLAMAGTVWSQFEVPEDRMKVIR